MMRWGIISVLVLTLIGGILYVSPLSYDIQHLLTGARCLKDTERALYEVLEEGRPGKVRVSVVDTLASTTVWSRELIHPVPDNVHSFESHNCGYYLQQSFGYDFAEKKLLDNYKFELWRFRYFSEKGTSIVVLEAGPEVQSTRYGSIFSVDPTENYLQLERGFLGKPDYALVIKNIETGEDEYVLTLDEVLKEHPNAAGSFDVGKWVTRPDGEYLFTTIYDGSRLMAYVYIKLGTWETEIYDTPSDQMAGIEGAVPPFAPLMAYTDVIVWAGFAEMTDQLIEEQIASGKKKHLIVANLRTGEKKVVEEVPIIRSHRFKLKWLSDTELEYTMPSGEKRVYKVQ